MGAFDQIDFLLTLLVTTLNKISAYGGPIIQWEDFDSFPDFPMLDQIKAGDVLGICPLENLSIALRWSQNLAMVGLGQPNKTSDRFLDQIVAAWPLEDECGRAAVDARTATVRVALRLAWVKHHYPVVFYLCVLDTGRGQFEPAVYLNAVRRAGGQVFGPDVNRSEIGYSLEGTLNESIGNQALRIGLGQLTGLCKNFIQRLLLERQSRIFLSLNDFLDRMRPRLADIRPLIRSGSLDSLAEGMNRPQMFWTHHFWGQADLLNLSSRPPTLIHDYSDGTKLRDEFEGLGLIASAFALDFFLPRAARLIRLFGLPSLAGRHRLPDLRGQRISIAGLAVGAEQETTGLDRSARLMTFEDAGGFFVCSVSPEVWSASQALFQPGAPILAIGTVIADKGVRLLEVERFYSLFRTARGPT